MVTLNSMEDRAIEMSLVSKRFGDVVANQDVNFNVSYYQIHALLGENGAGKSTLMSMLAGIYQPDSGVIKVNGQTVQIHQPKHAIELGIGMVHQHFKLVDNQTVLESIIVQKTNSFFRSTKKERDMIEEMMRNYHLYVPLDLYVHELSVSQKQCLEIVKVLYIGARILVLDEPTAVLAPQEVEDLYKVLVLLKNKGCAIIIITHKLNEVISYSDEVTVLHQAKSVYTGKSKSLTETELTYLMVGKEIELNIECPQVMEEEVILTLDRLTLIDNNQYPVLQDISLQLRKGEVLGVAGIAGSGQKELCEAIAGLKKIHQGSIYFKDELLNNMSPRLIAQKGISMSFIPEDRLQMGLVASMGITDNLLLKSYYKQKGLILKKGEASIRAKELVRELNIVTPSIDTPVGMLSGGNIQKVLLGRELDLNPKVIITAYALRGLDVQATYQVYELLNTQKKKGTGIIFIGEDLDVLMALCDTIAVMCEGKLMGIAPSNSLTKIQIGKMMAGQEVEHATH